MATTKLINFSSGVLSGVIAPIVTYNITGKKGMLKSGRYISQYDFLQRVTIDGVVVYDDAMQYFIPFYGISQVGGSGIVYALNMPFNSSLKIEIYSVKNLSAASFLSNYTVILDS